MKMSRGYSGAVGKAGEGSHPAIDNPATVHTFPQEI